MLDETMKEILENEVQLKQYQNSIEQDIIQIEKESIQYCNF